MGWIGSSASALIQCILMRRHPYTNLAEQCVDIDVDDNDDDDDSDDDVVITNTLMTHTRPRRWSVFRAMRYRWFIFQQRCDTDSFLEKLNIAIVAIIFLDHRERLFFDYFAHFRTDYFGIIHDLPPHFRLRHGVGVSQRLLLHGCRRCIIFNNS